MTLLELTLETAINEAGEFKDVRLSKEDAEYVLSMLKEQVSHLEWLYGEGKGDTEMPDREKVIKDLEKIHTHFWIKFRGCGIKAEKAKYQERLSVIENAITLLKEKDGLEKAVDQEHRVNEYLNKQLADRPEIVRCKDCTFRNEINCPQYYRRTELSDDYFCADRKRND